MFIEGDRGIFEVTPPKGINEASFLIRVKDPSRLDFEKVTSKCLIVVVLFKKKKALMKQKYRLWKIQEGKDKINTFDMGTYKNNSRYLNKLVKCC